MKKLFISLLFIPIFLFAQEFDKAYLESLPEDIRKDLESKIEEKELTEEPVYRRSSTALDKDIDEDEEDEPVSTIFGADFFSTIQTSFMPINEPNLDSTYILDFGDTLEIQLIGQENSIEKYSVARDGSINISNIGKVVVSGLPLGKASSLIKAKVKNAFIGTEAYVSLQNIRDISILIVGNAFNPGIYTLNGNSNMLHALSMAGGINEFGSYRSIDLVRNGEIIDSLDIYELLIYGKYNSIRGLRSGDSIVVNPLGDVVSIESGVLRKGRYEIKESETFKDLLQFANGFSKNVDKKSIGIKRIEDGKSYVISISIDELYSFNFLDNDSIFIREHKFKEITIEGAVYNPGNYVLTEGSTLSDLINIAGGYEKSAYPFGGYLENDTALNINEESKTRLYNTFLNNFITNSSLANFNTEAMGILLSQIKDAEVTGRVIAEFDLDVIKSNPDLDTILEDGDRIFIPTITQQVYIQGEVSNSGALRYSPNKDLDYYLKIAGGPLKSADLNNIYIVHPNGETTNLSSNSVLSFMQANNNIELIYPGSIIYVPQTTDFAGSLEVASIWAPIISSIALSLTSLSVLNNSN